MKLGTMDMMSAAEGLVSHEQRLGHVLAEDSIWTRVKEHEATYSANMVVNTYNRRCSRSLQKSVFGSEKALVVWVDGAKGKIDSDIVPVEEVDEHIFDPLDVIADGPPHSIWVLQKIQDFNKMVGVSCDGYESKLLQLFEELETSRGQGMSTKGSKSKRKDNLELKRLKR